MTKQDLDMLEILFNKYRHSMLRRAMQYVNNQQDAEDIVSESWLALLKHFPKITEMNEKARSTYILKSVQNTAIDFLRKAARVSPPQVASLINKHTEADINSHEHLFYAIERLPAHEKRVVLLKSKGYDNTTISKLLNISQSSVRVYLHRAFKHIEDAIRASNDFS